ncbi:unnamed protein product [Blepharisma stoltei]|uniref:Uncharacterized protein n=1 Tax=Blepharisma stoltei TaxID=1481888 RepID=A0AAU9JYP2_9CILI|nr:unnamed protein product [Blepharisma stoltei]
MAPRRGVISMPRDIIVLKFKSEDELREMINYMIETDSIITKIKIEDCHLTKRAFDLLAEQYGHKITGLAFTGNNLHDSDLESLFKLQNLTSLHIGERYIRDVSKYYNFVQNNRIRLQMNTLLQKK